jgi:hypothetical protein
MRASFFGMPVSCLFAGSYSWPIATLVAANGRLGLELSNSPLSGLIYPRRRSCAEKAVARPPKRTATCFSLRPARADNRPNCRHRAQCQQGKYLCIHQSHGDEEAADYGEGHSERDGRRSCAPSTAMRVSRSTGRPVDALQVIAYRFVLLSFLVREHWQCGDVVRLGAVRRQTRARSSGKCRLRRLEQPDDAAQVQHRSIGRGEARPGRAARVSPGDMK